MDNADKITDAEALTHQQVQLFLGDELKPLESAVVNSYNLEDEYAKTKKNKNFHIWIHLAICLVVVVVLTVGIIHTVNRSNQQVSIKIDTFDDLNLQGLLNMVDRTESLYQAATKNAAGLQSELDAEIRRAGEIRDNELFTLESVSKLRSKRQLAAEQGIIQQKYKDTVAAANEKYLPQIEAAQAEVEQYKTQLQQYDSNKVAQAQKEEAALDSQKQLHNLEIKNLTKTYEDKIADLNRQMASQNRQAIMAQRTAVEEVRKNYQAKIDELDPQVQNDHGEQVIDREKPILPLFDTSNYTVAFAHPEEGFVKALNDAEKKYLDYDYLYRIVSSLPQEKNIPQYVDAMRQLTYDMGDTLARGTVQVQQKVVQLEGKIDGLEKNITDLQNTVRQNEQTIAQLYDFFEQQCNLAGSDALIMETTDKTALKLYVKKASLGRLNSTSLPEASIRDGKKVICEVTLQQKDGSWIAVPKDPAKAVQILQGQKIYFAEPAAKR